MPILLTKIFKWFIRFL